MPPESLSLIERYGSFGLVCVLFLGLVFYVGPKLLQFLEQQRTAFTDELKEERKARQDAHNRCEAGYAKHAEAMAQVTQALSKVTDRLERVEDRLEESPQRHDRRTD